MTISNRSRNRSLRLEKLQQSYNDAIFLNCSRETGSWQIESNELVNGEKQIKYLSRLEIPGKGQTICLDGVGGHLKIQTLNTVLECVPKFM
jgi:hypothetical protein